MSKERPMAEIKLTMQALGNEPFGCAGCGKSFERAEQMNAAVDSEGNSLGWLCDECVREWLENGETSQVAIKIFGGQNEQNTGSDR